MSRQSIRHRVGGLDVALGDERVDVSAALSTFYALNELRVYTSSDRSLRHSAMRLRQDVDEMYNEYVKNLATMLRDYLVLSCISEARHAPTMAFVRAHPTIPSRCRADAWEVGIEGDPEDISRVVEKIFDCPWPESYGGEAWRNIAETIRQYGRLTDEVFIDHVVDLSHNSGCALDKGALITMTGNILNLLSWKRDESVLFSYIENRAIHVSVTRLILRAHALGMLPHPPMLLRNKDFTDFSIPTIAWGGKRGIIEAVDNTAGVEDFNDPWCEYCDDTFKHLCDCDHDHDEE